MPAKRAVTGEVLRYAHPFFTNTAPESRPQIQALHAKRMSDFIHKKLGPIPAPSRTPVMDLEEIIGKQGMDDIAGAGAIRFQATGDTGNEKSGEHQEEVAGAMAKDFTPGADASNPAFFLHLGDVIYGPGKDQEYRDEFYRPYMKYPGKIVAIAGNHDGEVYAGTDPKPLRAFLSNFCAPRAEVPTIAADVRIFRQTMTQPGVYWLLQAPFVNIIGLYSNIAEGPGDLTGANGDKKQLQWLAKSLSDLKKAKDKGDVRALIIATHHPPFSEGGHSGSTVMLNQIDQACKDAGIQPHAMLAGHAHNYQRYTRKVGDSEMACLVAGCGGHNDSDVKPAKRQKVGDAVFEASRKGFGYLRITVDKKQLRIDMMAVPDTGVASQFDTVTVDIATHRVH